MNIGRTGPYAHAQVDHPARVLGRRTLTVNEIRRLLAALPSEPSRRPTGSRPGRTGADGARLKAAAATTSDEATPDPDPEVPLQY